MGVSWVLVPSAVSLVAQADPIMLTNRITPIAVLCALRVVRCRPRSIPHMVEKASAGACGYSIRPATAGY